MTSNDSASGPQSNASPHTKRAHDQSEVTPEEDAALRATEASNSQLQGANPIAAEFYPQGKRSLSGIAVRAFCLGCAAVLGFVMASLLVYLDSRLWRPWLFLAALSIFHFLEFYTTAAYNTPIAWVSSFLLTNGDQYRQAHTMAFVETCVTSYFFPHWQARIHPPLVIALGLLMVVVGQVVRSTAMAQAGTNFNHTVQSRKNHGHELVTSGLYAYFRHPSYFGFFWWGIGTQVLLGNAVCFLGYTGVLWYFFNRRISRKCATENAVCIFTDNNQMKRSIWYTFLAPIIPHTRRGHAFGYPLFDYVLARTNIPILPDSGKAWYHVACDERFYPCINQSTKYTEGSSHL
jgi:protein-S-isoprenylcysteine O-methyltransferase